MINEPSTEQTVAAAADPSANQLAALRTWLAAEALKIRHRLPFMRVPESWGSMDGMAQGLDYAVRVIDRFAATGKLPVTGGKACDCADPEADHQAMAAAAHERARVERDDELARLRAQVAAVREYAQTSDEDGVRTREQVLRIVGDQPALAGLDGTHTPEAGR